MPRTLITRLACAVAVTLLTFVGLAAQSTDAATCKKLRDPPADSICLPAGVACAGFDLLLETVDASNLSSIEFQDEDGNLVRFISAGKGSTLRFTNLLTDESLVFKTGGSVQQVTIDPDGTQTVTNTGHNVVILFPTDVPAGPSTTLYIGKLVYTVDTSEVFTVQSFTGTSTDICAALSP
jgi:hypothetical protein